MGVAMAVASWVALEAYVQAHNWWISIELGIFGLTYVSMGIIHRNLKTSSDWSEFGQHGLHFISLSYRKAASQRLSQFWHNDLILNLASQRLTQFWHNDLYLIQYWRSSCKMEITLGVYRSAKTFYVALFSSYICSCMQILWGIWDGSRERWLQVRSQLHLWSLHLQMRVSLQVPDFSRDNHRRWWSSLIYVLHMCRSSLFTLLSSISMKLLITENKVAMVSW